MSVIVHIEHPVHDYARWKAAFDSDPIGRQRGGVRRYRISRAVDDPLLVIIDLEFDAAPSEAQLHEACRDLLSNPVIEDYQLEIQK